MPKLSKARLQASPVTPHESSASKSKRKRRLPSAPLRRSKRRTEKPGEWWKITKRPERRQLHLEASATDSVVDEENPTEISAENIASSQTPRGTRARRDDVPTPGATTRATKLSRGSSAHSTPRKAAAQPIHEPVEIEQEKEDDNAEMRTEIEPAGVFTPVKRRTYPSSSASPRGRKKGKRDSAPPAVPTAQATLDFTTPPVLRRLNTVTSPPPNAPRKLFKPPARFRTPLNRNESSPGPSTPANDSTPIRITRSNELKPETVGCASVSTALTLNGSIAGELLIPPRASTDQRRADDGDEFFCLISGVLECSIAHVVVTISAGDYIAIPHMSSYLFHNRLGVAARLIFFAPKPEEEQRYNGTPNYLQNL